MVVNLQGDETSQAIDSLTSRVSFPVYQDTPSLNIWNILDGEKDDILVYDRCGQLSYHVRMPHSNLQYNIVQRAIQYTYHSYDPCNCNPTTSKPTTVEPSTELLATLLDDENLLLDETQASTIMLDVQTTTEQAKDEEEGQFNEEEAGQFNEEEAANEQDD